MSGTLSDPGHKDRFINTAVELIDMQVAGIETRDVVRNMFDALPDDRRMDYGNAMLSRVMERSQEANDIRAVDVAKSVAPWPWSRGEAEKFWDRVEEAARREERRTEGLSRDGVVLFEVLRQKVEHEMRALSPDTRDEIITHILKDIHERERRDGPVELTFGQLAILEPADLEKARFNQADRALRGIEAQLGKTKARDEINAIVQSPYVEKVRERLHDGYPSLADELELSIREARKFAGIEESRRRERAEERTR